MQRAIPSGRKFLRIPRLILLFALFYSICLSSNSRNTEFRVLPYGKFCPCFLDSSNDPIIFFLIGSPAIFFWGEPQRKINHGEKVFTGASIENQDPGGIFS